jgi:hypothetical protein
MLQEPWEGLPTEPRTADTSKIRLTTYQNWFAVPQQIEGQKEKGYPEGMPGYIKHTSDIPFAQVIQLMRLRTGAHHLRVETERWKKPRLPRSQRVCEKCTWGGTVEDEFHLLFECPRYHHIRLKYERDLFADFWGATGVARVMTGPGKVQTFMEQEPRKVAAYVWECLEYQGTVTPDLIPYVSRLGRS